MPTNLLLLPLLAGYWFLHQFSYTRFRSQRLDGYRLLVESAAVGVLFVCLAWRVAKALSLWAPAAGFWKDFAPNIPFLGTGTITLLIGLVAPYTLNAVGSWTGWMTLQDAQGWAIARHGNHLLRILHFASANERVVALTLQNRKVYIGMVAATPNLEPHDTFLAITPFFSGCRRQDTLDLQLTVDYLDVYEREGLDPSDFRIVIPISSIATASLFDQNAYTRFVVEPPEGDAREGLGDGPESSTVLG